ncbi:hypothetical protein DFH08DRAFT_818144 [Mycena albidolilacea]|uniref:Uncharacterized protein n=1 Tax=Mycena albidolilacea TaxID=1033008 RepID=A0AAD6ZHV8_9AGAR|nr:hypothetical protein DFH08DRAFT_818144 [Mycena albidolilacea]
MAHAQRTTRWLLADSVPTARKTGTTACAHLLREAREENGLEVRVEVDDVPSARTGRLAAKSLLCAGKLRLSVADAQRSGCGALRNDRKGSALDGRVRTGRLVAVPSLSAEGVSESTQEHLSSIQSGVKRWSALRCLEQRDFRMRLEIEDPTPRACRAPGFAKRCKPWAGDVTPSGKLCVATLSLEPDRLGPAGGRRRRASQGDARKARPVHGERRKSATKGIDITARCRRSTSVSLQRYVQDGPALGVHPTRRRRWVEWQRERKRAV